MHTSFADCGAKGKVAEYRWAGLMKLNGIPYLYFEKDERWDFIVHGIPIEVKWGEKAFAAFCYEVLWGEPSGVSVTQAKYYAWLNGGKFILFDVEKLEELIRKQAYCSIKHQISNRRINITLQLRHADAYDAFVCVLGEDECDQTLL